MCRGMRWNVLLPERGAKSCKMPRLGQDAEDEKTEVGEEVGRVGVCLMENWEDNSRMGNAHNSHVLFAMDLGDYRLEKVLRIHQDFKAIYI